MGEREDALHASCAAGYSYRKPVTLQAIGYSIFASKSARLVQQVLAISTS
jgi:hypothetical protein